MNNKHFPYFGCYNAKTTTATKNINLFNINIDRTKNIYSEYLDVSKYIDTTLKHFLNLAASHRENAWYHRLPTTAYLHSRSDVRVARQIRPSHLVTQRDLKKKGNGEKK